MVEQTFYYGAQLHPISFKPSLPLQEQSNTSKVCACIGKPLTFRTFSSRFIAYRCGCGVVQDGYGYRCSTGRVRALFRYVYEPITRTATGILRSRMDTLLYKVYYMYYDCCKLIFHSILVDFLF